MDNFKVIYKILKHLEAQLDFEYNDNEAISSERLGVSKERREQLIIMLADSGYVTGVTIVQSLTDGKRHLAEPVSPSITLKGLEYLSENGTMKKVEDFLKGVFNIASGMGDTL